MAKMYVEILFPGGLINNLPPVMHRDQPTKLEQQNFIQHLQFLPVICIRQSVNRLWAVRGVCCLS